MNAILEKVDLCENMDIESNLRIMIKAGKERSRFNPEKHNLEHFLEFEEKFKH